MYASTKPKEFYSMVHTLGQISVLRAVSICTKTTLISAVWRGRGEGHITYLHIEDSFVMPLGCGSKYANL